MTAKSQDKPRSKPRSASADVSIGEDGFDPVEFSSPVGKPVKWSNDTDEVHSIEFNPAPPDKPGSVPPPNSGDIRPGGEYSYTFTAPGTYDYHCGKHSTMKGRVKVS